MKLGYSNLLGEYVKANVLEYRDCEHWQIVCPACREPVFVCKRNDTGTHYLSHYRAGKAYDSDCELRVKGVSDGDITVANSAARSQKIRFFLRELKTAVVSGDACNSIACDSAWFSNYYNIIKKSKGVRAFLEKAIRKYRSGGVIPAGDICRALLRRAEEIGAFDEYTSGFSATTQTRIVVDIEKHLKTNPVAPNLKFILRTAFLYRFNMLQAKLQSFGLDEAEEAWIYFMNDLIYHANKRAVDRMCAIHKRLSNSVTEGLFVNVTDMLLSVNWFNVLKTAQTKEAAA